MKANYFFSFWELQWKNDRPLCNDIWDIRPYETFAVNWHEIWQEKQIQVPENIAHRLKPTP